MPCFVALPGLEHDTKLVDRARNYFYGDAAVVAAVLAAGDDDAVRMTHVGLSTTRSTS